MGATAKITELEVSLERAVGRYGYDSPQWRVAYDRLHEAVYEEMKLPPPPPLATDEDRAAVERPGWELELKPTDVGTIQRIYYAVPTGYGIGEEYETFKDAIEGVREKAQCWVYFKGKPEESVNYSDLTVDTRIAYTLRSGNGADTILEREKVNLTEAEKRQLYEAACADRDGRSGTGVLKPREEKNRYAADDEENAAIAAQVAARESAVEQAAERRRG